MSNSFLLCFNFFFYCCLRKVKKGSREARRDRRKKSFQLCVTRCLGEAPKRHLKRLTPFSFAVIFFDHLIKRKSFTFSLATRDLLADEFASERQSRNGKGRVPIVDNSREALNCGHVSGSLRYARNWRIARTRAYQIIAS